MDAVTVESLQLLFPSVGLLNINQVRRNHGNQYLPELQYKAKSKCEVEFVFFTCYRSIRVLYFVIMLVHMNDNCQKLKLNISTDFHDVKR
jgi:hypothetical protein